MKTIRDWRWSLRLIGDALVELRVRPVGVIHIGAHLGQEVPLYLAAGFERITLVEPDPEACAALAGAPWIGNPGIGIVNCAAGPARRAAFHRAADGAFSGLARDERMPELASFDVDVVPAVDIQNEHPGNVMIVDTQGTELDVLGTIDHERLDLIVVEAQRERRGAPGAYWPDLMQWCREAGWLPRIEWSRDTRWSDLVITPRRVTEAEV